MRHPWPAADFNSVPLLPPSQDLRMCRPVSLLRNISKLFLKSLAQLCLTGRAAASLPGPRVKEGDVRSVPCGGVQRLAEMLTRSLQCVFYLKLGRLTPLMSLRWPISSVFPASQLSLFAYETQLRPSLHTGRFMGPLRLPEAQRSSPAQKTSLGQQTDVGPGGTACCLLDPLPTRSASGCFSNALSSWHYGGLRGGSLDRSLGARMTSLCWWACSIFQKFRLTSPLAVVTGQHLESALHGNFTPQAAF